MAISDVFKEKSKNARSSRKRSTTPRHRAHKIERERRIAAAIFHDFFLQTMFQGMANLNCFNFIPRFQYFNRNKLTIFLKISYLQMGFKIDT